MRLAATDLPLERLLTIETIDALLADDTGFLMQGSASVGVSRQDTGSAGKSAHCPFAVSLTAATGIPFVPLDTDLSLSETWGMQPHLRCGVDVAVTALAGVGVVWLVGLALVAGEHLAGELQSDGAW